MNHTRRIPTSLAIALFVTCSSAAAQTAEPRYTLTVGPAHAKFNVSSTEVTGPAGTTPPGATLSVKDLDTVALEAALNLDANWSLVLAVGVPPKAKFTGQGSAAALGEIGSARAWFPALLAAYRFQALGPVRPYVAAGINYTFYTQVQVASNYTAAFGGTSSSGKVDASLGPVLKLGAQVALGEGWLLNAGWARYGIRNKATVTTDTPGVGPIARLATLRSDPDVFSLLVGRSF